MTAREPAFRDAVQRRYNLIGEIWDNKDRWHAVVHKQIGAAVERLRLLHPEPFTLVVDVGSGGGAQPLPHRRYLQIDLAQERLSHQTLAVCADAHSLPLRDGTADCLVCVGSVVNYCSLIDLAQELGRVCAPGGLLLLHAELSNSLEYIFRRGFRAPAAFLRTHYQGKPEDTWVYSDANVRQALLNAGFETIDRRYFHIASALAHRLGLGPAAAARFAGADGLLGLVPGIGGVADSVIVICERKPS